MKTRDLIIKNEVFELLEIVQSRNGDSVAEFIKSCSINITDFANFLKKNYDLEIYPEVKTILKELKALQLIAKPSLAHKTADVSSFLSNTTRISLEELLNAEVHLGHLKRKLNPNMAPYIYTELNGIHVIDLQKTILKLEEATVALKQIALSGKKILFVATKKQAKAVVAKHVKLVNMPYITERWSGGMLTNFSTIRKAVKKMYLIDKMTIDGTFENISKKEQLQITRQRAKLEKHYGSISNLTRLPSALFIVDILKEQVAVDEARRLNIPTFAIVDTNSDPNFVDFPIPANDDSSRSISLIIEIICNSISQGLQEREKARGSNGNYTNPGIESNFLRKE